MVEFQCKATHETRQNRQFGNEHGTKTPILVECAEGLLLFSGLGPNFPEVLSSMPRAL